MAPTTRRAAREQARRAGSSPPRSATTSRESQADRLQSTLVFRSRKPPIIRSRSPIQTRLKTKFPFGRSTIQTRSKSVKPRNAEGIISRIKERDRELGKILKDQKRTVIYNRNKDESAIKRPLTRQSNPMNFKGLARYLKRHPQAVRFGNATVSYPSVNICPMRFDLFRLPGELRIMVYEMVAIHGIDDERAMNRAATQNYVPLPHEPALTRTSRTVRNESLRIFYRNATFKCHVQHNPEGAFRPLLSWFNRLGSINANLITKLDVHMTCCSRAVMIEGERVATFHVRLCRRLPNAVVQFKGNERAVKAMTEVLRLAKYLRVTAELPWDAVHETLLWYWEREFARHINELEHDFFATALTLELPNPDGL